jgi:flagellar motor switch protein FliM
VAPNEIVVVIVFEVKVGQTSGMMNYCIPAIYLDPFAMELRQENRTDIGTRMTPDDYQRIDDCLANAVARLCLDLTERRISIRQLLGLREGDLLPLEKPMQDPASLKVAGMPKYRVAFGARKRRKAARILSLVADEEPMASGDDGHFEAMGGMARNG